jgi:hypothetical protein
VKDGEDDSSTGKAGGGKGGEGGGVEECNSTRMRKGGKYAYLMGI